MTIERYFFEADKLPTGFSFPKSFLDFVQQEPIPPLDPWWFLCKHKKYADFWLDEVAR